ncbi:MULTISPECIES: SDR family NAD(P)-dependent oxidoreductase [Prauserella salsuginis group]|uniref:SDR family NAD(P)-dependent oxidoreductase n=1 Tax=Prauserella salsuginis TaxID=387889 RepID=A0ABW6G125_9PSEU|nr:MULTISPECIES: SDR family oxidoreductase [Prauserella salsuginis group]MCR3722029.1 3-oxoacyl-[acyl-carrier protein] reductase [Prauserella flava]MCR3736035.1 3-oxoacyl-[acyl-carrier protein] reductase [Prauserella salsuginis]
MSKRHAGRSVFITGAGGGIGRETALRLAGEGARVMATDVNGDAARETADLVEAKDGTALSAIVDVRVRSDIRAAAEAAVEAWGSLNLLVNNAGLVTPHSLSDLTEDAWDLVLDVNLKGQFLVAQELAPRLGAAGGGAIVNLSTVEASVVVTSGSTAQPHYNASKGGVPMLTKALAVELAAQNIRVNCVAPGPIATDFFSYEDVTSPEAMEFMGQRLLVNRVGTPADVASAVSWLLSDEAAWIDGIELPVDGGWLTR